MDRMKKIKRQLSMTLRGSRTVEKNLNEPINIEENNSSDNGPTVKSVRPGTSRSVHAFLHQYAGTFRRPRLAISRSLSTHLNRTARLGDYCSSHLARKDSLLWVGAVPIPVGLKEDVLESQLTD
uniref:Uncharacterized protein n=2 Tax=Sphaerodactylus townsendi TaxID=933632 RepID=A0ACB8EMS5_9SAUR